MASTKGNGTKMVVWAILGLLIIALGGFGTTNFGGTLSSVGSVGDEEITIDDYAVAVQNQLSTLSSQIGQNITVQQAETAGLTAQVLDQLVDQAALNAATKQAGLSIGDVAVRQALLQDSNFQGLDGKFDADRYRDILDRSNQSEKDYEAGLRQDGARALLQAALANGISMPASYGDVVVNWLGQRRTISTVTLSTGDLISGAPIADDAQILAQYEENPEKYTAPETRAITYAWLAPQMISDSVDLDETALRELYDTNINVFIQPDRRLVERLVYADDAEATAALERITAGETTFDDEVTARGLNLADADLGDVSRADLADAGDLVFDHEGTGVVGPAPTNLGPAIFRINGTLEGTNISFEDARADLSLEMAADAARRVIADEIEPISDALAFNSTLEELAEDTDMELGHLNWTSTSEEGIAAYSAFKATAIFQSVGDVPEVVELSDGGIFALRVDEIIPPTLQPLEQVRDQVAADWEATEVSRLLQARAEAIETDIQSGTDIATLNLPVDEFKEITRQDFISTMPNGFIDAVFAPGLDAKGTAVLLDGDRAVIAHIDAILPPAQSDDIDAIAQTYMQDAGQGAARDVIDAFSKAFRDREGVTINQQAISAVHSQL